MVPIKIRDNIPDISLMYLNHKTILLKEIAKRKSFKTVTNRFGTFLEAITGIL
jgi:hypothetical protein